MPDDVVVIAPDGVQLAMTDHGGSGPTVLVLHGVGEHRLAVERLATALLDGFRVLSMDLRWSGRSGSSPVFGWDLLATDVAAALESVGEPDGFVVGHSLGGIVATHHGASHETCAGIVNVDGWGFGDPGLYDGFTREDAAAAIAQLREKVDPLGSFQRTGDAAWATAARSLLRRPLLARGVPSEDTDRWLDRMVIEVEPGTWRIQPDPVIYESMRSDAAVFDLLRQVHCPALVVTSDVAVATDPVVAARRRGVAVRLQSLQRDKPNLAVATIAGSDHNSLVNAHAEAVAAKVREFGTCR